MKKLQLNPDPKKIQQLFSGRLYSDKFHFITEVVSNAKDAHTRIKQDKPIEVSILPCITDYNKYIFEVRDYGCSMTPEEFRQKIGILAYSDKEDEADTIGNMGIGSIAFTAFAPKATYTCIKNGEEFTSTIRETDEGIEFDDNFIVKKSTEPQGVIFQVEFDKSEFIRLKTAIISKLAYFGGVVYDFLSDISFNSFNIYRNDLFQVSDHCSLNELHLTLDDVMYPIDFNKLGINRIQFPVAIRFTTQDNLRVSTTRESIIYDENVKKLILSKIQLLKKEVAERWNATQRGQNLDLYETIEYLDNPPTPSIKVGKKELLLNLILSSTEIKALEKPQFTKNHSLEMINFFRKEMMYRLNENLVLLSYSGYYNYRSLIIPKLTNVIQVDNSKFKKKAKDFVKSKFELFVVVSKKELSLKDYKKILSLQGKPKDKWRELIDEYQKLFNALTAHHIDWSKEIPYTEDFNKSRKRLTVKKETDLVNVSVSRSGGYYQATRKIEDLYKEPIFTVYAYKLDRGNIDLLHELARSSKRIQLMLFNKKDYEKVQELKLQNFATYKEFMSNYRILSKAYSSYLANKFYQENTLMFYNTQLIEKYVSKDLVKDMNTLLSYKSTYGFSYLDDELMNELHQILKEHDLIDPNLGLLIKKVQEGFENFAFIKYFAKELNSGNSELISHAVRAMRDLAYTRRKRLNWETYLIGGTAEVAEPTSPDVKKVI